MQKINTMEVTSQITWELKPPFTVNLVHFNSTLGLLSTAGTLDIAGTQYSKYTR